MRLRRRSAKQEMAIGARVILSPNRIAVSPIAAVSIIAAKTQIAPPRIRRVHQTGESPFGVVTPIGGKSKIVVFDAWIFAEGALKCEERSLRRRRQAAATPRNIFERIRNKRSTLEYALRRMHIATCLSFAARPGSRGTLPPECPLRRDNLLCR